jgi:hypothetical protein
MIHKATYDMNQRGSLPSRRLVFLTTAAFAVTIGALFASTSCDFRSYIDLSSLKPDQKHDSCLLELSDGRWELMTDGYEPELVVGLTVPAGHYFLLLLCLQVS